jgi:hypothetical protein
MASKARGGRGGGNQPTSNNQNSDSGSAAQRQAPQNITGTSRGGGTRGGGGARPTDRRELPSTVAQSDKAAAMRSPDSSSFERKQQAPVQGQVGIVVDSMISPKLADADLIFLPFFPEDNGAEPAALIDTAEVLKIAERGLDELLSLNLHRSVEANGIGQFHCSLTILDPFLIAYVSS